MSDVSVVICGYTEDRWDRIVGAVASLRSQTVPPQEIIFVSDHNPALLERADQHLDADIIVANSGTRGLSDARNTGVRMAKGSKIAFLDDDAEAAPNWIEHLSRWCDQPDVIGAGSRVDPVWANKKPSWFPDEFYWTVGCSYVGMPTSSAQVRNPFGGAMCVSREIFDRVGGFRVGIGRVDNMLAGCEETELCIRANELWPQKSFMYEPEAVIMHYLPKNREKLSYFLRRCFHEGRSKALLSKVVDHRRALQAETSYVLRVLPRGALRNVIHSITNFEMSGLLRAGTIVLGLGTVGFGYLVGLRNAFLIQRPTKNKNSSDTIVNEEQAGHDAL